MCNNNINPNNVLLVSTAVTLWIYNNLSSDSVNYLGNLFQMIGQNLSSMISLQPTDDDSSTSTNIDNNDNNNDDNDSDTSCNYNCKNNCSY